MDSGFKELYEAAYDITGQEESDGNLWEASSCAAEIGSAFSNTNKQLSDGWDTISDVFHQIDVSVHELLDNFNNAILNYSKESQATVDENKNVVKEHSSAVDDILESIDIK